MKPPPTRDYGRFDSYLNHLTQDVYAQPPDEGHTAWAKNVVRTLCTIPRGLSTVLDVGCGQGFLKEEFEKIGLEWTGVTIGEDFVICKEGGLPVHNVDMSFLPFDDKSFDLIFARHVLEHSPFPIVTLMEWKRVCRGWMVLVAPAPYYWGVRGRNHYSVMWRDQLLWTLARAGWKPIHLLEFDNQSEEFAEHVPHEQREKKTVEYRMLCEQIEPEVE